MAASVIADLPSDPLAAVKGWVSERSMVILHSGRVHPRWARYSLLAQPACWYRFDHQSQWIGDAPAQLRSVRFSHDPLTDLQRVLDASRAISQPIHASSPQDSAPQAPTGGWIGWLAYELGRRIEPRSGVRNRDGNDEPLIELAWCPEIFRFDHLKEKWEGNRAPDANPSENIVAGQTEHARYRAGPLDCLTSKQTYLANVARVKAYIAAGDIFQANIAQQFQCEFEGSARQFGLDVLDHSQAWYGGILETPQRTIVSMSPELFLEGDLRNRTIVTRPIKGTRAATVSGLAELCHSPKDAAELHMIVDLMRNDLGRVCEFGSVVVPEHRAIETHTTVHHGVAEIQGRLREGTAFTDILRATFPGGSITGAPKIRAMQIIDELEQSIRGPYCGSMGYINNDGRFALNIAIRTIELRGKCDASGNMHGTLRYAAGAGIVADSDAELEYQETLAKTLGLRNILELRQQ